MQVGEDMTNFDNMANAINKRLINIAKRYGIEHPAYKDYAAKLQLDHVKTRMNSEGVIQISRQKPENAYQVARVQQLYEKGKSVKTIRAKERARMKKEGVKASTISDIDKNIKDRMNRQQKIDEMLDVIYKYLTESILPADLYDHYQNFWQHNTSNEEIDMMIDKAAEFDQIADEIKRLHDEVNELDQIDDYALQIDWELQNGRYTVDETKEKIQELKNLIEKEKARLAAMGSGENADTLPAE